MKYFVSYSYSFSPGGNHGFGELTCNLDVKISDEKVLGCVRDNIKSSLFNGGEFPNVVILNWRRFDDSDL